MEGAISAWQVWALSQLLRQDMALQKWKRARVTQSPVEQFSLRASTWLHETRVSPKLHGGCLAHSVKVLQSNFGDTSVVTGKYN